MEGPDRLGDTFGERTMSDEEWETFIAAIEEAKGRPLVG